MAEFFAKLFGTDFLPHVYCLRSALIVWLSAVSDAIIAAAYFIIPALLLSLARGRRDLARHWLFPLFAAFILGCGLTHALGVVTLWVPIYRFDALIKLLTALASILTAIALVRLLPEIVNHDITVRLRADETAQRLAELVESSNDAIIGADLNGLVNSWNRAAETLFGYTSDEIVGQPSDTLINPAKREAEHETWNKVAESSAAARYESTGVTKSGRELAVAVTISPIRNARGKAIGTSRIIRDISDAKAHEEAVRVYEERQRLAVEAGQIGLWYLDLASHEHISTARARELHGIGPDGAVTKYPDVLNLIHSDDRGLVRDAIEQVRAGKETFEVDYRTRGLDYRLKWLQMRGRAQRDGSARVIGIHGTVIDLTAHHESEEKLRRLNTELEQFAYAAAHDLQEPLRNVALASDLLRSDHPLDEEDRPRFIAIIGDNARRMEAMVKDLLAFSRSLESGGDIVSSSNAAAVLEDVLGNLAATIAEKNAVVTYGKLPMVSMAEFHLMQILQNLIGNALKYAGKAQPQIHINAVSRNEDVVIFVRDNGIGIAPEFHNRVFRIFKRLHTDSIQGTGIGLAVCKRIVEHYGGRIWIDSVPGEGAAFYFTIPTIPVRS